MHHFHPPAPKSCTTNQQLNSLTACQYLPCGSNYLSTAKKEGQKCCMLVPAWGWPPFLCLYTGGLDPLLVIPRLHVVVISFCVLQRLAFPCCLQLWGRLSGLASGKCWPVSERSRVRPWVFTVGSSQFQAWVSKPRHCPMCVDLCMRMCTAGTVVNTLSTSYLFSNGADSRKKECC